MKNIRFILLVITTLILVSIACGSLQVGVVSPTMEQEVLPEVETQEPTSEVVPTSEAIIQPTAEPTAEPQSSLPAIAYRGQDGNLWYLEAGSETPRQVTFDANRMGNDEPSIEYNFPRLSSDGTLLAYQLDMGIPSAGGYDLTAGLWVLDLRSGEQRQVLDGRPVGWAWQPGTHTLAYGPEIDMNYFINRGQPDPALAAGILTVDLDNGETQELVSPERGYALAGPNWSPDGRFLAFEEVFGMEGSGLFGYYDIENRAYVAWEEAIGRVSWSPDGSQLTYSRQTYAANGEERLYLRPRQGDEQLLGPDYDGPAYATQPVFSPNGDQIAYLAYLGGPETQNATLMVLDLDGAEPKPYGSFESLWEFAWSPDGRQLIFSAGPWESPQIIALNLEDGSQIVLDIGTQPTVAGP